MTSCRRSSTFSRRGALQPPRKQSRHVHRSAAPKFPESSRRVFATCPDLKEKAAATACAITWPLRSPPLTT
eukprot:6187910-Pleurochrysis_carterae.AAC.1